MTRHPTFGDYGLHRKQNVEPTRAYLFEGIEDFLSLTEMSEQKF